MRWQGRGSWVKSPRLTRFRRSIMHRTGSTPFEMFEELTGLGSATPTPVMPVTGSCIAAGSAGSWEEARREPRGSSARPISIDDIVAVLARVLTTLLHGLTNRPPGDLYLIGVERIVAGLPDPDSAWLAVMRILTEDFGLADRARTATVARLANNGEEIRVSMPPGAEAFIEYLPDPEGVPIDGQLRTQWLRDELVRPIRVLLPDTQGEPDRTRDGGSDAAPVGNQDRRPQSL